MQHGQTLPSRFADLEPFVDAYCDRFPLDDMPDDAARLLRLVHSFVMVSFPVEVWGRPDIPETGDAYLDRVVEPGP